MNIEQVGEKLLDRVDVRVYGSGVIKEFGLTNDINKVQTELRQTVAQVYVTMPHPSKIIPYQMIHAGRGISNENLTDPTLTASWPRIILSKLDAATRPPGGQNVHWFERPLYWFDD